MNAADMSRQRLMKKICELSFALVETQLYLDTHPMSRAALDYYRTTKSEYDRLAAEYEMKYAPILPYVREDDHDWRWVREPWPWELGFPESGEAKAAVTHSAED